MAHPPTPGRIETGMNQAMFQSCAPLRRDQIAPRTQRSSMVRRTVLLALIAVLVGLALAAQSTAAKQDGSPTAVIPGATPGAATPAPDDGATAVATTTAEPTGDSPIVITATAAFGGTFKLGEWLPVDVTLENHGPDTNVEVQASTGSGSAATTFVVPVDLPAGTRKNVTLYTLPESLPRTFDVIVVDPDGDEPIVASEVRINPLFQTDTLCGTVGYPEGSVAALGRVRTAGAVPGGGAPDAPVHVAPIDMATFPTIPEGLYSFDCIVFGGAADMSPLSADAQAALAAWVNRGGQLFVASGERWQSALASLPPDLLPVTVETSQTIDNLSPLRDLAGGEPPAQQSVVAVATLKTEGNPAATLAGSSDLPLVVEGRVGNGRVTFLAFDPDVAPIAEWDGADDLWKALLRPYVSQNAWMGTPPEVNPRSFETAPLVGALSQISALDLPSIKLLAGLLGAYLIVISPINYLVLRRLNKLSWAWATTIILVGVFALAAYGLGARIRGSDVIVNTISIVQSDGTGSEPVTARTYVGLFSPSKSSYVVDVGGGSAAPVLLSQMPPSADPWSSTGQAGGGTLVQGEPAQVRDLGVSQWASRFFMAEHHPAEPPRVVADLQFESEFLRGTVTNPGTVAMRDCVVFVGTTILPIGTLGPGETKPVELDVGKIQPNPNGFPLSFLLLGFDRSGPWPDMSNDRDLRMRQMILDTMYGYGMNGPMATEGINFVGWADAPLMPISISGHRVATVDTVLLTSRLSATFAAADDGTVTVPPGLIAPVLTTSDAESAIVTGHDIQVYGGSAEVELRLPLDARPDTVTRLTLHLPADGMMGGPLPNSVQLYDVEAGQFVPLDDITGEITIEHPERYYDPELGVVRLKIEASGMNPGFVTVHLSLDGTRGETT